MNAEQILAHFDRISEAPEAIPAFRRFILDLAVRGKLVEQNPKDEPASELLKRTHAEKGKLFAEGEIKKLDQLKPVNIEEIAFDIPHGWGVVRMGWIARKLGAGSTPLGGKSVYTREGIPFLRSQNVHNDGLRLDDVAYISHAVHERMSGTHVQPQDILLNITGASIGRCALVPHNFIAGNVSQHVAIIRLFDPSIREFIHLSLTSPFFQSLIDDFQVGVSREGLSMHRLRLFPMLVPPLAEQRRILTRVSELMALCDRLETAQAERERRRNRLAIATLQRLSQPGGQDATAVHEHARFYLRHLPRLTTRHEQIKQLRQTVLDLAVHGRLVRQRPDDGDAKSLLKLIHKDHVEFWRQQTNGKPSMPELTSVDGPYRLPQSWIWAPAALLTKPGRLIRYGILKPGPNTPGGVPYVRIFEMKTGTVDVAALNQCDPKHEEKFKEARLKEGDIIVSKDGTIGRVAIVPKALEGGNITQHLLRVSPSNRLLNLYLALAIQSPPCQAWMTGEVRGLALQGINVGDFRQMPIPLPTLAEQQRIVAKVNELMTLCDQLEAQLTTTQTESRLLLEAVLHEALTAA